MGQVTAGEAAARTGGRGDDARDGEGRAGRRGEGAAGVAVERDAAVGGEAQVDRGAQAAVGGQREGRRGRHGEFGAEGGLGGDDQAAVRDGNRAREGRVAGEGGRARADEGEATGTGERGGQGQGAAAIAEAARAGDGEDLVGREGRAAEVEGEGAGVQGDVTARERARGVETQRAAVDGHAQGRGVGAGEGESAVGDDGRAFVGVGAGEDEDARAGLGETAQAGEDAREGERLAGGEVVDVEGRIGGEGEVRAVGGRDRLGFGEDDAEGGEGLELDAGVVRGHRGGGAGLDAETPAAEARGGRGRADAAHALLEADVEVIPAGGRRGEGAGREGGPAVVVDQRGGADLEHQAVVEGLGEAVGAGRQPDLADVAAGGVERDGVADVVVEGIEVGGRRGDGRDSGGARVAGEVEGAERAADGVEGQRAAGEGDRASAEGGRQEAAHGDGARVDGQAAREGAGRVAEGQRARAGLGQAERAADGAAEGEGGVGDVEDAVAGQRDRTLAEVEGARAGEGDVAAERDGVALGVDERGGAGVVEDEAAGDGERAGAQRLGVVQLEDAGARGDATREGVGHAEGELGGPGLDQAARALERLVDHDVAGPADGQRAVDVDVVVGAAAEGQDLTGDGRVEEERAAGDGVDGEALADAEAAVVAEDLDRAAREDAAGRVVGQLAEVAAVTKVVDDQAGARADGDDGGVVVGRGEDLGRAGEVEHAARDGEVAGEGVERVGERQATRADLGEGEGETGLLGQETREGGVDVLAADGQGAREGVRRHGTVAGEVTDRLGRGGHGERGARVEGHEGGVRDAVQGRARGHADLQADAREGGDGDITREGAGGAAADGGAVGAGEGHVARAGDAGVFGAVGAVAEEGDVAVEGDAVEAEGAGTRDAGGGAEGDGAGGPGGHDDRGGDIVAGGRTGGDQHRQVARARVGVTDGQGARTGAAQVVEPQRTLAEDRAADVGVVGGAAEGQRARARLDHLGVAGEGVARGAVQDVVGGRVAEVDQGRRQVAREGDGRDGRGVVEGDDVAVDELVRRAAQREVVGGVIEGAAERAGPGQLAEAELQGQGGVAHEDGRVTAVAAGAGDGEEVGRRVGRAVGGDRERIQAGGTARQADRHLGRAGRVDREGARGGEGARGHRVDDEDGVAGEGRRLGGALPAQRARRGDVQVGIADGADQVQAAGDHVGRAGVGVGLAEGQRARAVLVEAGGAGEDDVEVLGRRGRGREDAAALGRDRAAAEEVLAEGEAAGGVLRVEDRARAGHGDGSVDLDGGAGRGRVTDGRAGPGHDAGGQVVGPETELLRQVERATGQVVLADGRVDRRRAAVVEDDPRRGQGAAGLVEDTDAVHADVHAAGLLGPAGRAGAGVGVGKAQRTAAQVVSGDVIAPVRDTQGVGDGDRAAGLVDVTGDAGGLGEEEAAGLDGRTGVDVEDGAVGGATDAQDTGVTVGAVQQEVDRAAVHRQARADRVDFDVGLGQGAQGAAGDREDLLAREERVAVLTLEAEERLTGVTVDVEGDRAAAQRTGGGGVGGVADDQVGVRRRGTGIDPDVIQRIGADVVRAGQLDDGLGAVAADDEDVGVIRHLDRTGERAGRVVGGDLGVAGQGDGTGEGRAAVDAEGADAARHPELVAAGVVDEGRGRPERRRGQDAAIGVRILVAGARDADIVREGRRRREEELAAVLDDDVGRTQLGRVGEREAGRAGRGHGAVLRADGQGAGIRVIGGGEGDVTLAGRAELVRVDEDRTGAGQGTGHDGVAAVAGDAEGRGRRHGDGGGPHVGRARRGELEDARVDVGRAGVGIGAREGELAVSGLGQAHGARTVGDHARIIAGGEARGEVSLVEVEGERRGGAHEAVTDRRGVAVTLQAHQGLTEASQVEGGVRRAAEVEHQAGGQAFVRAEHRGVGVREADALGGAATRVDDEAVALTERTHGRGDVERAGDPEGVGERVAA